MFYSREYFGECSNFRKIPQLQGLSEELKQEIEIVGHILPFKVNNFVLDHLINWDDVPNDPIFIMTFPQKQMLLPQHYEEIARLVRQGEDAPTVKEAVDRIHLSFNPNPAGQMEHNIPYVNGEPFRVYSTSINKQYFIFPVMDKPAMPIVLFVSAGHSLPVCRNYVFQVARLNC